MDGETLLHKIGSSGPRSRSEPSHEHLHRPSETQSYLQKPFSTEQLAALIRRLAARKAASKAASSTDRLA